MTSVTIAQPKPAEKAVVRTMSQGGRRMTLRTQILSQIFCILVAATVLFPLLWVVSMAIDPRNIAKPDGLNLIPPGASLASFEQVIAQPSLNPVSFLDLARNSLEISLIVSFLTITLGSLAAYAMSRLHFTGRQFLMIAVLAVLMLPAIAELAPLYVLLNNVVIGDFNLRNSIPGVALAVSAGTLPFAIWNMKGYIDTIPRELEEAAAVDGANKLQIFLFIVLPLARPVLAVTAFFGFIAGWTEFYFSWTFLDNYPDYTLAMVLNGMTGQYGNTPWSQFAAFAILVAVPVTIVYLLLQRYIVAGLAIGGVKG
jgi:arabinogalactan oligomer/maltooligosaccharide transport system permease protein